jgi:phosphoenolpyruvate carboxykinase (GTP)
VPVDAIIFGGRTRDREPLVQAIPDLAEGVYDGLPSVRRRRSPRRASRGELRYDPMSMRPFMSYPQGAYAEHWLQVIGSATDRPLFAHVNWFQRDPEGGRCLWPGYRDNLRALLWLVRLKNGEVTGTRTPVGIVPTREELDLTGADVRPEDSTGFSASRSPAGRRRWRTGSSTSPSSTGCPRPSGKRIDESPPPSTPRTPDAGVTAPSSGTSAA